MRTSSGSVGDVAFHGVHAVHDDHGAAAVPGALDHPLEAGQISVIEAQGFAVGHLGAVDDRGVVQFVQVHHVTRGR